MSLPAAAWLSRHPHLLVRWLAVKNGLRRFLRNRRRAASAIGGAAIACFALLYAAVTNAGSVELIEPLLSYWPLVALLAALHAAMMTARGLHRFETTRSSSWLASAPVAISRVRLAERLLAIAPVLLQWIGISGLIAILAAAEAASPRSALTLIAAMSVGAMAGSLAGLWAPRSRSRSPFEASRYVRAVRVADLATVRPADAALSRWPVNLTLSWGRPENSRVLLVIALFAVQGGSSILSGLTVVAMWVVAAYLGSLLAAVTQVAREASAWLRSTPMRFHAFAWPIARRALLHQLLGTTGAAGVMMALGASPAMAFHISASWLGVVVLVCSINLASFYRAGSPTLKLALSLSAVAAVESREHAWAIPLTALLTVWHLRSGMKS
jgi:hypothetical protein